MNCGIGVPWGPDRAKQFLRIFYPIALDEMAFLARQSSDCIVSLHSEVTSGYVVALLFSLTAGLLGLVFSKVPNPKYEAPKRKAYIEDIKKVAKMSIILVSFVYIFTRYGNSIPGTRKAGAGFDGVYTNMAAYWLHIMVANLLSIIAFIYISLTLTWVWRFPKSDACKAG